MGLLDWFGRKDEVEEPWRKFARANVVEVLNADTGEMTEIRPDNDDPDDVEGLLIGFDYVDAQGVCTTRDVLCYQTFWNGGGVYVRGLCTMRESLRTFRVDRMENVRELRSGAVIPDPESFFSGLARYDEDAFDRRTKPSRKQRNPDKDAEEHIFRDIRAREDRARKVTMDGLRILAYLSLSDGWRSEDEASVEVRYIESRLSQVGLGGDPHLAKTILFMAQGLAPTRRSYTTAIGKIANDGDHLAIIAQHALELARIDGEINAEEREALNILLSIARKKRA